jgi:hypothetical protein
MKRQALVRVTEAAAVRRPAESSGGWHGILNRTRCCCFDGNRGEAKATGTPQHNLGNARNGGRVGLILFQNFSW